MLDFHRSRPSVALIGTEFEFSGSVLQSIHVVDWEITA